MSYLAIIALDFGARIARSLDAVYQRVRFGRVRASIKHIEPPADHLPSAPVGIAPWLRDDAPLHRRPPVDADGIMIPHRSRVLPAGANTPKPWYKTSCKGEQMWLAR